jgi:exonuclease SbcC
LFSLLLGWRFGFSSICCRCLRFCPVSSILRLFIDEGFGSLDAETLETAMRTLDHLRASGRTVGVISHVTSMHERIPTHIEVRQLDDGSSRLETRDAG